MNPAHYVSLELTQKLHEAGIEFPDSEKIWTDWKEGEFKLKSRTDSDIRFAIYMTKCCPDDEPMYLPAPNLSEILDELPRDIDNQPLRINLWPDYSLKYQSFQEEIKYATQSETLIHAAALMLLKVKEETANANNGG